MRSKEMAPQKPQLIVGVGASAGGIEACRALLAAVPAESGLAFILVLHLDPRSTSHIAEILQSNTEHLTISQVASRERLEPNHAYVIAPSSKLELAGGHVEVDPLVDDEPRGRLIDRLFASLAEVEGAHAAGVVLSGAGHDGTEGLRRIRAAGGLALAQDPATASSASMPRSALDAEVVDAALALEALPAALIEFARSGARPRAGPSGAPSRGERGKSGARAGPRTTGLERILAQIGAAADVDFGDYKKGTLQRRTRRRMQLQGIEDWDEYAERLTHDRDEREALYHDVLIGVTEFFREPDVWDQLGDELPALLEQRDSISVRVWVPGCGTGEEAYSLAMLLRDRVPAEVRSKVQIYATDLNERALAVARRGLYAPEAALHVTEARRDRYFNQQGGQLLIDRSVRDCVTFAAHNALSDPPFSKMDVVSCRNLLIYLKPQAHDRLLKRLHFALHTRGLLVLGRAETLGRSAPLFDEISKQHSIFRARAVPPHERLHLEPRRTEGVRGAEPPAPPSIPAVRQREPGPSRRIEQFVLRERTPACVVLDAEFRIRHFYGRTQDYLLPPTGESRDELLAWIRPGFYVRMRSALTQAIESGEPLSTDGQIDRDGETHRVRCNVEPLPAAVGAEGFFLVTFHDLGEASLQRKLEAAETDEPLVRELERELFDTRRDLESTIEQLESAGEEHHASHEELQSLNEELQSSNEELEASKEELEALNEEMNTINSELEQKISELREANADLNNLFLSTGVPTVFLDRDLRVRRFTSAASDVMRLVPSDAGRSIEHIKERFDDGRTVETCRRVIESGEKESVEVTTDDGRWYVRDILPYQFDDEGIGGVCITFSEITEQQRAMQRSEAERAYTDAIVETVRTPMLVLDESLRLVSVNHGFRVTFDATEDLVGRVLSEVRDEQWNVPRLDDLLKRLLSSGTHINDFEVMSEHLSILVNARRVEGGDEPDRLVLSFEDVTAQREARSQSERRANELREDGRRKDEWIAMLGHELRNPIGALGNAVSLMESTSLTSERHASLVAMMARQVSHVAGLLDELLDAARIISGKLDIEHELVDLTRVGEWAVDTLRPQIDSKGHELVVVLPPEGSVWIQGDALRLTEVTGNLLGNAVRYTEPGGVITLEISAAADSATISVRDTGIGIPSALQDQIFDIFTQGPRSLDRSDRGLGLGLPLVRALVHLHGGKVEVDSAGEGRGSEFRITLPRALPDGEEGQAARRDDRSPGRRSLARRVLIVDDERDAADTLDQLLQIRGHATCTALDGPRALEMAREFEPEVALLDLGMPGMDGYELSRRLRNEFPHLVVVAVTGYRNDADRLESAGFDHHLIKPIDVQRLENVLAFDDPPSD